MVINKSVSVLLVVPGTSSKTGLPRSQLINKSGLSILVRLLNTMRVLENTWKVKAAVDFIDASLQLFGKDSAL